MRIVPLELSVPVSGVDGIRVFGSFTSLSIFSTVPAIEFSATLKGSKTVPCAIAPAVSFPR